MSYFGLYWNSENEYPAGLVLLTMIKYLLAAKAKLNTCQKQRVLFSGIIGNPGKNCHVCFKTRKRESPAIQSGLTGRGCNSGKLGKKGVLSSPELRGMVKIYFKGSSSGTGLS